MCLPVAGEYYSLTAPHQHGLATIQAPACRCRPGTHCMVFNQPLLSPGMLFDQACGSDRRRPQSTQTRNSATKL